METSPTPIVPAQLDLILTHDGHRWAVLCDEEHLSSESLEKLDNQIRVKLRKFAPANVAVRFDLSSLPTWLRQYQSHYCNYLLKITP